MAMIHTFCIEYISQTTHIPLHCILKCLRGFTKSPRIDNVDLHFHIESKTLGSTAVKWFKQERSDNQLEPSPRLGSKAPGSLS